MAVMGRQVVSLPFVQGVDSKTDSYLALKPSRVENRVVRGGTLQRRYGTRTLTAAVDTGGTLSSGESLDAYDAGLVRMQGGNLYTLAPAKNAWHLVGTTPPLSALTRTRLVRNNRTQLDADWATANGVTVVAWAEASASSSAPGLHILIRDSASGAVYQPGATALAGEGASGAGRPKCLAVGQYVHVYFHGATTTHLALALVDTLSPTTAPALSTLRTDAYATAPGNFVDAVLSGTNAVVLYAADNGAAPGQQAELIQVSAAGVVAGSPAPTILTALAAGTVDSLSLLRDGNGALYCVVTEAVGPTWYAVHSAATFAQSLAKTAITATDAGPAALIEQSAGSVLLLQSNELGVGTATLAASGVSTAYATNATLYGLLLISRPFLYQGRICVAALVPGTIGAGTFSYQPSVFVVDSSGNVLARCLIGEADLATAYVIHSLAPMGTSVRLANALTASGAASFLAAERGRLAYSSASGTPIDVTARGVTAVTLTPAKANALPRVRVGEALHLGGAMPQTFDGSTLVEEGFNLFPVLTPSGTSAGTLTGTFLYAALYSWTDAKGQLCRSAPCPAVSVTVSAHAVVLTITALALTAKQNLQIEVYRTTNNGTVLYRVNSVAAPTYFAAGASTVTFTDNLADTSLVAGEILYTTGGVNDNIAPPPYSIACGHKTRLVIAGIEDPFEWRSSSVTITGEGLRFNESWGGHVPPDTGPITALDSMDGNLIIFTASAAYLVQGDGPDLLGNNNWPDAQLITALDTGPISPVTLSAAAGVFYQSSRGWMLLTRGLGVEYIGADVERYSGLIVRCALARPEFEEVWFQVDDGTDLVGEQLGTLVPSPGGVCLVYNARYQQWSVLTGYGAQSACYYGGRYTRVRSDGAVLQEAPGAYDDSGAYYPSVVETAWLKPAQLVQGYQRVWRASVLGLYGSDATLTWDAAYDYSPTYSSPDSIVVMGNGVYTPGAPFQVRRHLRVQKCEALKFRFTDSGLSGTGQGIGLTSLDLEFGGYGRLYLLPAAQSR